jgi:CRP-like cAMP-binding protein
MGLLKHYGVLLQGVACLSTRQENGGRQIYAFHYPGDFLDLHNFLLTKSTELCKVRPVTSCSVGRIDRDELEREMQIHPALGRALWLAAAIDARIFRQSSFVRQRLALQRVAHLLCEQLTRLEIDKGIIPLNHIDIADAVGLSVVHTRRVLRVLGELGALSKQQAIEIVNKVRLQEIADFDGRYLDVSASLSHWDVRIEC